MTAIDDILKAEKEAASAIEEARLSAEKKLAAAKTTRETSLSENKSSFVKQKLLSLQRFQKDLETKTKSATVALSGDADQIRHNFTEKKSDLIKFVKESL